MLFIYPCVDEILWSIVVKLPLFERIKKGRNRQEKQIDNQNKSGLAQFCQADSVRSEVVVGHGPKDQEPSDWRLWPQPGKIP